MRTVTTLGAVYLLAHTVQAATFFKETFSDGDAFSQRWTVSDWRRSEKLAGDWEIATGPHFGDTQINAGLRSKTNNKFFEISSPLAKPLSPVSAKAEKPLILQFSVQHGQRLDCGGGYIKLLSKSLQQKEMSGDSKFHISFGPDICGTSTRHILLNLRVGEQVAHLTRKVTWKIEGGGEKTEAIRCATDPLTHVYTLTITPDNKYDVQIDGESRVRGDIAEDFAYGNVVAGHIERELVEAGKDLPATKKVRLSAADIDWADVGFVGFDLWQVKAGSVFDNILVTDSEEEAKALRDATWGVTNLRESEMWEAASQEEEQEAKRVRQQVEAERARQDSEAAQRLAAGAAVPSARGEKTEL